MTIIDLFAGPGGWDTGLAMLGRTDVLGIEWDKAACDTARAFGHERLQADIAELEPSEYADDLEGLIASPPCQGFSMAGKGRGREDSALIIAAVGDLASGVDPRDTLRSQVKDYRSVLALEPLRWALELEPDWTAWEQVPAVLPLWEACAEVLRADGYSVWTGLVQAEQYGVPQTRKRAILTASRNQEADRPAPTHSKFYSRTPSKLDPGVAKWVSMAEALGWGMAHLVGFPRRADSGETVTLDGVDYRARDLRPSDLPAQTVTEKARSWERWEMGDVRSSHGCVRSVDLPAPTLTASMDNGNFQWRERWVLGAGKTGAGSPRHQDHPAPTITGAGNAHVVTDPEQWVGKGSGVVYVNGNQTNSARRRAEHPAPTIHFGERLNAVTWQAGEPDRDAVAAEVEPRVNNQSGTEFDLAWPADRPAPVVAGRDIVTMPGANANRFNGRTKSRNDGIRVTVQEAAILQSFPGDYPWQGTKTAQYRQVGDAVPPLLAAHVLASIGVGELSSGAELAQGEAGGWAMQTNQGNPRDGYHRRDADHPSQTVTAQCRSWNWVQAEGETPA